MNAEAPILQPKTKFTNFIRSIVPLANKLFKEYPVGAEVNKKQIYNYFIHALNYSIQDKMDSVLSEHDLRLEDRSFSVHRRNKNVLHFNPSPSGSLEVSEISHQPRFES